MSLKQTFKIYIKNYNGIPISMYKHKCYSLCQEIMIQSFLKFTEIDKTFYCKKENGL